MNRCHDYMVDNFIKDLELFLESSTKIQNHVIVGDFNIDILKIDPSSLKFISAFFENGYVPSFS